LHKTFDRLVRLSDHQRYEILSLGIGSPGTISQPEGTVTDASPNIKGWQGAVLTEIFENPGFPVLADNDANCVALAEYLVDFKCRYKNMVFVTIGTGIGGGLVIDGKLHRGADYSAAEIGHTIIRHNGRLCRCGRHGCLEAYASVPNMMKRYRYWARFYGRRARADINPRELYELYESGNRAAIRTIKENADYLGVGLGSIMNVLNPQALVIGGGFADAGKGYINLIKESIRKYAFQVSVKGLKISRARFYRSRPAGPRGSKWTNQNQIKNQPRHGNMWELSINVAGFTAEFI
jgi:glucokinase